MKLVLLGTGTPNAAPDRSGPAAAIVTSSGACLIDLGPGIVRQCVAASEKPGLEALAPQRIHHAVVTHLHSDHTAGYPDAILTPWVLGRREPLNVWGPPGLRSMTDHLLKAYERDIDMRRHGLEPTRGDDDDGHGWSAVAHEIASEEAFTIESLGGLTVMPFRVRHGSWLNAYGYRFEAEGRTIVVSGDTAPSEALEQHAQGCDLLLHEAYAAAGYARLPMEWQRYHVAFHTSAVELGEIAARVRPGKLILTHALLWGATPDDLIAEVRQSYDGDVVLANDLDEF